MCRGVREGRSVGRAPGQDRAGEASSEPSPAGGEKTKAKWPRQRGQPVQRPRDRSVPDVGEERRTPLRPAAHLLMLPWQWANAVNQAPTFYLGPGTDRLAGDAGRARGGGDHCLTYRPSVLRPAGLGRSEQPIRGQAAGETPTMRAGSPSRANLTGSSVTRTEAAHARPAVSFTRKGCCAYRLLC